MFEVERIEGGLRIRYGTKSAAKDITDGDATSLYEASIALLRIVKVPDVYDIFSGLSALRRSQDVIKVRVQKGAVTQETLRPIRFEVPPADLPKEVEEPPESSSQTL